MAKLKPSHFLNGVSGKMKDVVFRQIGDKTVACAKRILSEKQKSLIY